ncbi:hypothetical protein Anapl_09370 [Anas platyrhynchos]|uniref:Uncharacterized protein n=1 Tax=Anas platyrhynchos TaxID=8839 RepID=R0LKR8_ANAPL|nr:hypothetical protein Anapl_09370 [Anas platyrhynchos]
MKFFTLSVEAQAPMVEPELTEVGELHSLTDWQVSEASEEAELDEFCSLPPSKKPRGPVVQTCSAPRQLIRTEKQIIGGSKASSLGLRHRAANVTYRHKFSDILTCNGTREKLIRVQILWNRERSDTYQGWRFPKVYACASAGVRAFMYIHGYKTSAEASSSPTDRPDSKVNNHVDHFTNYNATAPHRSPRPSQAKDEARYPAENIVVVEGNILPDPVCLRVRSAAPSRLDVHPRPTLHSLQQGCPGLYVVSAHAKGSADHADLKPGI